MIETQAPAPAHQTSRITLSINPCRRSTRDADRIREQTNQECDDR
jgi:hypothetical protein